jgi:hypothetical protein
MGKKKDLTESESDTETDTDSTDSRIDKKNNSVLNKINKLSRKAKLYIGICVVLLLAGLYMWYKNKKNNVAVNNEVIPQVTNTIQPTIQTGNQEILQTIQQGGQVQQVLSHLTPEI